MERNLDPNPPAKCFLSSPPDESVIASETKTALARTVVQISLQLAGHQLVRLPLFLSARELLFLAKSFLPVQGIKTLERTGGNIHWQTSTVKKYTQWDRVVDSIDRSIPWRGSRTWELSDWLYSVILARRTRTTKTRSFNRASNGCEFFLLYIKNTDCCFSLRKKLLTNKKLSIALSWSWSRNRFGREMAPRNSF